MIAPLLSNLPKSGNGAKASTSSSTRLEDWRKQLQTHEQLSMGQSTERSEARMKAFLDDVEKKIDGDKEVKNGKKRSSNKTKTK